MNENIASLENNLLAKKEFFQLSKLLNRFNIFEATDMGRREIKHTKFLCYLLDPNESHGLGDTFIKNFLTLLAERIKTFPRLLDLDFTFAEVTPEYKHSEINKESIDCYMRIPMRGESEKAIYIAIENKIDSKQGINQLNKYRESFEDEKQKNLYLIYLTFHFEEPNTHGWEHVTYSDTVLPSVMTTIEMIEDTGSINLKAALNDYLDLLIEDEEGDKDKEQLANNILLDGEIKKYFSDIGRKTRREYFGDMYVKHKKLIDFVCQLDTDIRTPSLEFWNNLKEKVFIVEGYQHLLTFSLETSVRTYLRFSLLTSINRQRLSNSSKNSRKWLNSNCPIAFEVVNKLIYKKTKDANGETKTLLTGFAKCEVTLVLGPMDENQDRTKLLNFLYKELNPDHFELNIKDENFKGVWNRLISNKDKKYDFEKTKPVEKPLVWIQKNVLDQGDNGVKLNGWVLELSANLNKSLDEYFASNN